MRAAHDATVDPARRARPCRLLLRLSLALAIALAATVVAASPASADIVDRPVRLTVQNINRTAVPCAPDGATYNLRGHLVGPHDAVVGRNPSITLWLHGATAAGDFMWRFNQVPGYDFALEMAKLGHVSLIVDQLGYGRSPIPHGAFLCEAAHADMAHQIIGKLRSGEYTVHGMHAPRFAHVGLGAISLGGSISEVEAYSFHDIDALVNIAWADGGFSTLFVQEAAKFATRCAQGGQPKYPGSASGYAIVWDDPAVFYQSADPAIVAAHQRDRELDACGMGAAFPDTIASNQARVQEITERVLLVFGRQDRAYDAGAAEQQRDRFTGSNDVTLRFIDNAGHVPVLDGPAARLRSVVSRWLGARGL